jgi:hypothetical protein
LVCSIHRYALRVALDEQVDSAKLLEFECPRCKMFVTEYFYGPCGACIAVLRDTQGLGQKDVAVADYVPKMNVTPNAVATKD